MVKMLSILFVAVSCCCLPTILGTPLDDYVNKHDPNYNYTVLEWKYKGPDYTLYLLNMTSQKWLTEKESDHPIWYHSIIVAVPDKLTRPDTAFMYIGLGSNSNSFTPNLNDHFLTFVTMMAVSTGTICYNVRNIPNQPIVFKDPSRTFSPTVPWLTIEHPRYVTWLGHLKGHQQFVGVSSRRNDPAQESRKEDAVIAWTWRMFVEVNPDKPEWLLRLPMTKAAVRAMDTVADFGKKVNPKSDIKKFMVCGESKRGWTTWTTGAVDKRVVAIAPIVMDLLNFQENLHHHYRSLGGWTFAFADYYALNFTRDLDNPNTKKMRDVIDPYSYIDKLTMPKYIITTGGDEFFIPDDGKFYLNALKGETYLRRIANAEHSLTFHRLSLFFGMQSFYLSILDNATRPQIRWEKNYTSTGGILTVYTNVKPHTIGVQHTRTVQTKRRDFRLMIADPNNPKAGIPQVVFWVKNEVENVAEGVYQAKFDNPPDGWEAFYIEMTFAGSTKLSDYEFCTETMIIPNVYPFPDCHGTECLGKLV